MQRQIHGGKREEGRWRWREGEGVNGEWEGSGDGGEGEAFEHQPADTKY